MSEQFDDNGIDPAIAEAMGFSGFGAQPGKKRKFDANETFVDPGISKSQQQTATSPSTHASSANKEPVNPHSRNSRQSEIQAPGAAASASDESTVALNEQQLLQALRNGVRNENGDTAFFLPSFLEDPWKDLRTER